MSPTENETSVVRQRLLGRALSHQEKIIDLDTAMAAVHTTSKKTRPADLHAGHNP